MHTRTINIGYIYDGGRRISNSDFELICVTEQEAPVAITATRQPYVTKKDTVSADIRFYDGRYWANCNIEHVINPYIIKNNGYFAANKTMDFHKLENMPDVIECPKLKRNHNGDYIIPYIYCPLSIGFDKPFIEKTIAKLMNTHIEIDGVAYAEIERPYYYLSEFKMGSDNVMETRMSILCTCLPQGTLQFMPNKVLAEYGTSQIETLGLFLKTIEKDKNRSGMFVEDINPITMPVFTINGVDYGHKTLVKQEKIEEKEHSKMRESNKKAIEDIPTSDEITSWNW